MERFSSIGDGNTYREVSLVTSSKSRVAEVQDVEFPKLLDPVDDRPSVTVITHVSQSVPGAHFVRGTTSDNGTVKNVLINGRAAKTTADNFAQLEVELDGVQPGETKPMAGAEDAAGNIEMSPHSWVVQYSEPRGHFRVQRADSTECNLRCSWSYQLGLKIESHFDGEFR